MASNGSFNTNSYDGRHVQFNWSVASQSVTNNNTTIDWSISAVGGNSSWYKSNPTSVYINGNRVYYNGTRVRQYKGTIASGSYTISHDNDGNGSFNASVSSAIYSTSVNCNGSSFWSLPQIARASQPSCITWPNTTENIGNIGDTIYIHMNRHSDKFTHNVWVKFGELSEDIAVGVTNNCRWTIPDLFYSQIPNANSGNGTIYVDTFNGDTKIGTKSVDFTCNVANANPTIENIEYYDENQKTVAITEDEQIIIRNNSNIVFMLTNLTAIKSATLSKLEITLNGVVKIEELSGQQTSLKTGIPGYVNSSSNLTASIVVIDSRGNSTTYTKDVIVWDWVQPSAIINCQRENNFYSKTYLTVDGNISSLNNKNTMTIQYQYKKTTDTNYSSLSTIQDNTQTSFNIDNNYAWNVRVIVSDKLASTSYNLFVDKGVPIVYFDRLLSSMGINCFPTNEKSVEINGKTIFDMIYPVGSIYMSINSTSPSILFGGTWEQIKDRFLLGASETYSAGSTGGEETHTLTIEEVVQYDMWLANGDYGASIKSAVEPGSYYGINTHNNNKTKPHNNMPPYLSVYMWKRTA